MRSLLNFFRKYSNVLIFLLLELTAFYLLYNGTSYHNIRLSNGLNSLEASLQKYITRTTDYFSIREENEKLVLENLDLRNSLERITNEGIYQFYEVTDTAHKQQYIYTSAEVVNQTVNKQKNFITLNKGTLHGIEPGMAVAGPDGIVGVIVGASKHYSVAMSVLNVDFKLSARFKYTGYFGSLAWNGTSESVASLQEIPHHVEPIEGDTIETSGYSSIFPEGIMIGTVKSVDREAGDFLNISINLSTDFRRLHDLYVIGNLYKGEKIGIENEYINMIGERND